MHSPEMLGGMVSWHKSFWGGVTITTSIVGPQAKLQGGSTAPPIRKLAQASYPYPSEGSQNGDDSHRKLTKRIVWITDLGKSMSL